MFFVWGLLSAILLGEALFSLRKVLQFKKFFEREISKPRPSAKRWPTVALLAPCKGVDFDFHKNIQSWFSQDYPGEYKIFFIVESDRDPAAEILQSFPLADLLIAGKAEDRGQKVHNLSYAIANIPERYETLLFVDSDCLLNPDWMRNLVDQLENDPDDAATGYRWFTFQRNFGSLLRAVWNSSILTLNQEKGRNNFAWGGSMAITRSTFNTCKVADAWKGSVSDDYSLTLALQANGRCVRFVPGAVIKTSDCESLTGFLRWAFRQLLITRIYYPRLWFQALVFHTVWLSWIILGCFYPLFLIPSFVLIQGIQGVKADLRWRCVPIGNRVSFWITGPVIGLCNSLLLIGTLFTRKIVWRGMKYVLLNKNRVIVNTL